MRKLILLLALLSLTFAVPAFAQDDMGTAMVRIAYLVPDGPAVDLYVDFADGMPEGMDIPGFEEGLGINLITAEYPAVTEYLEAPVGSYIVNVTATGETDVVVSYPVDLTEGAALTVAVVGTLENESLTVGVSDDMAIYDAVPEGGAVVSVLNAIEGAPPVDLGTPDGVTLVTGLGYIYAEDMMMDDEMMETEEAMMDDEMMDESPFEALEIPSVNVPADFTGAAYTVDVLASEDGSVLDTVEDVTIEADTAYLVVVYANADGGVEYIIQAVALAEMMMADASAAAPAAAPASGYGY